MGAAERGVTRSVTFACAAPGATGARALGRARVRGPGPAEAETTPKATPLSAGGLARLEGSFLGERRIAFANGQTGWVRREDLVPVWR